MHTAIVGSFRTGSLRSASGLVGRADVNAKIVGKPPRGLGDYLQTAHDRIDTQSVDAKSVIVLTLYELLN
jgi:hypothetical protein